MRGHIPSSQLELISWVLFLLKPDASKFKQKCYILVLLPPSQKPLLGWRLVWFGFTVSSIVFKGSSASGWAQILQEPLGVFLLLLGF